MDIGSLLVFFALLLLVGFFITRPLFENRSVSVSQTEHEYSALLAERDRILDSVRELDMDNAMGKINAEDYDDQRAVLVQQGAQVLRQMDELEPSDPQLDVGSQSELALASSTVEQAPDLEQLSTPAEFDYDLENLVSARRQSKSGKAAGFCHKCGHPIQQKDQFCAHCGATV